MRRQRVPAHRRSKMADRGVSAAREPRLARSKLFDYRTEILIANILQNLYAELSRRPAPLQTEAATDPPLRLDPRERQTSPENSPRPRHRCTGAAARKACGFRGRSGLRPVAGARP